MGRLRNHLRHHGRFYAAALLGAAVFAALSVWSGLELPPRILAGGDTFFALYVVSMIVETARVTPKDLRLRAAVEDEGIAIVLVVALAMIVLSSVAVVTVLHQKHGGSVLPLALAVAGLPLGWFALHTLVAFHYAHIYYGKKGK